MRSVSASDRYTGQQPKWEGMTNVANVIISENLELYEKVKVLKKGNATKRQGQLIAIFAKMESSVNGMIIVI